MKNNRRAVGALVAFGLLLASPDLAVGQSGQAGPLGASIASPAEPLDLPFGFDGPAPPVAPDVIARDESGRATVRAVRLAAPLRVDGKLDEAIYGAVPPMSGFIQMEPRDGEPATERTDAWVTFDRDHVYVSFRCLESQPARVVANEMRRDSNNTWQGNDIVSFMFDTFYDRRNAVQFTINAAGGRSDGQVTNERQYSSDWNPVWEAKVARFDGGWTVEASVPFKSIRYRPGRAQIWGFNIFRTNRWKNELSFLTHVPPGRGQQALTQMAFAATLVGLEAPSGAKNLEIKPYATSNVTSDLKATPQLSNEAGRDFGLDLKYGVTQNVTADFTYNTDFAQVEADEQQVNLTRFNLQFPEKRDFFLENGGTFAFAGARGGGFVGGGGGGGGGGGNNNVPQLFYSRRIGLIETATTPVLVPIVAGGRLTGRVGRYSLGLLDIRTDDEPAARLPAANFSVLRMSRDVLGRSTVGLMYTRRSVSQRGPGSNDAYGVDGTFNFWTNLSINTYWARTETSGLAGDNASYRGQLDYNGDRYGLHLERLVVGQNFNPEIGFVRRYDMRRSFGQFRFSPRPRSMPKVRRFFSSGSVERIENGAGRLETRRLEGELAIEFQSSDRLTVNHERDYDFLKNPYLIATNVTIPVGGYDFQNTRLSYNVGQQRRLSGQFRLEHGTFYSGHKTAAEISRGRLNFTPRLSVEPTYSVNWVDLAEGSFTTHLLGSRVTYSMTPRMFASGLLQYNSSANAVTTNVRLRWEYRPGSELFVVYNEQRDTGVRGFPDLANRAFIVKVTRLFRL